MMIMKWRIPDYLPLYVSLLISGQASSIHALTQQTDITHLIVHIWPWSDKQTNLPLLKSTATSMVIETSNFQFRSSIFNNVAPSSPPVMAWASKGVGREGGGLCDIHTHLQDNHMFTHHVLIKECCIQCWNVKIQWIRRVICVMMCAITDWGPGWTLILDVGSKVWI